MVVPLPDTLRILKSLLLPSIWRIVYWLTASMEGWTNHCTLWCLVVWCSLEQYILYALLLSRSASNESAPEFPNKSATEFLNGYAPEFPRESVPGFPEFCSPSRNLTLSIAFPGGNFTVSDPEFPLKFSYTSTPEYAFFSEHSQEPAHFLEHSEKPACFANSVRSWLTFLNSAKSLLTSLNSPLFFSSCINNTLKQTIVAIFNLSIHLNDFFVLWCCFFARGSITEETLVGYFFSYFRQMQKIWNMSTISCVL